MTVQQKAFIVACQILIIPLLFLISVISFATILLPPGSYVETYVQNLERTGFIMDQGQIEAIYKQYGLDQPAVLQYVLWMSNFLLKGEMGRSFIYQRPVKEVIMERLPMSATIALASLVVTWLIAIPIGIYSALKQYSVGDYVATVIGFVGLALPNFLLALALGYWVFAGTGRAITGLFSIEYKGAPWSIDKFVDLLGNIWLPIVVIASAGTASLIRILRATLLDEKNKQICYHRTGKRIARATAHYEISGTGRDQSAHQYHRLDAAIYRQRRDYRLSNLGLGNAGSRTPRGSLGGGYVSGGQHRDDPQQPHGRRHPAFRYPTSMGGSTHPL